MQKGTLKALSRAGALIRTTARRSMRRGGKVSLPGNPPKARGGQIKKFLFFVVDPIRENVVIGPAKLSEGTGAPKLLEHGGQEDRDLFGKTVVANYEPRPFMGPALDKQSAKLPQFWEDALKG